MSHPDHDPSIENEPHLRPIPPAADPTEQKAARLLAKEAQHANIDDMIEQSVWDEPALSGELNHSSDRPKLTYAGWLDWRIATTSPAKTWLVTFGIILAAGPWSAIGALLENSLAGGWGLIAIVIVTPVIEETLKISIALWVVEKRPYLFRNSLQILLCAVAGGLVFATIENLLYLNVHATKDPYPDGELVAAATVIDLATWRWSFCTALHTTCSLLAGIGLARMWAHTIATRTPPQIAHAKWWIIAAMILHGSYNAMASLIELTGWVHFT